MIESIAMLIVTVTGLYFIALGGTSLLSPTRARRFFLGFAASQRVHFAELLIRLLVGGALVLHAPRMSFSLPLSIFGWLLMVTATGLLFLPWQFHQRFALAAVPKTTRYIGLMGLSSLMLGVFMLAAVAGGLR